MSEHETEAVDVEDAIAAQMSDDTEPGEPEPEPEPTDPEPESEPEPEPESAQAQMAKMDAYATKAKKYLAGNMDKVLGDDAINYVECPFCNYFNTPGFLHASPCPPELLGTVYEWTNTTAPDEYSKDSYRIACDACKGFGEVATGSKVRGQETLVCYICMGRGWNPIGDPPPGIPVPMQNGAMTSYPAPTDAPKILTAHDPLADPEAQKLRERGFIVIDPILAR